MAWVTGMSHRQVRAALCAVPEPAACSVPVQVPWAYLGRPLDHLEPVQALGPPEERGAGPGLATAQVARGHGTFVASDPRRLRVGCPLGDLVLSGQPSAKPPPLLCTGHLLGARGVNWARGITLRLGDEPPGADGVQVTEAQ